MKGVQVLVVAVLVSALTACDSDWQSSFRSLSKRGELRADAAPAVPRR